MELEGTSGSAIPNLGYIEVNLQLLGIKGSNEDVLPLVILTMAYAKKVQIMVDSEINDNALNVIMEMELEAGPPQCGHVMVTPIFP